MQGILAFSTLEEALRLGFAIYDRTAWGYIVRRKTPNGWALAIVKPVTSELNSYKTP